MRHTIVGIAVLVHDGAQWFAVQMKDEVRGMFASVTCLSCNYRLIM